MMRKQKGFSLIELLIVVAIILIISAIAIPNLSQQRKTANETAAVANLSSLNKVLTTYSINYMNAGFPASLNFLGGDGSGPQAAGLIDESLASGTKSGYRYVYTPGEPDSSGHINSYAVVATPLQRGQTGNKSFFTDQTGSIRVNLTGEASASDPTI